MLVHVLFFLAKPTKKLTMMYNEARMLMIFRRLSGLLKFLK